MARLHHIPKDASPVSVSQAGLIRLSAPARAIALDVLRVNSLQTGAYVSHFRGRGMEFDESRPYQPGDDPRSIDWRVTARSTTAYTKLFREERERPVLVCVDLRSNMHFATRGCFKSVNASRAAALISWAAHHRGDRLGGLIFGDTTHRELKPRLGRRAALRFVHELVEHADWPGNPPKGSEPFGGGATQKGSDPFGVDVFAQAMSALRRVARPGSLVVVISDFTGFTRAAQSYLSSVASHNEVLAVFMNDPIERQLPPPGRYRIVSPSDDLSIDTYAQAARRDYEHEFAERAHNLEAFCQRYGVHLMPMSTDDDPVSTLQAALGRRSH
ncbi:MAG: DUF58 domain-containing protein [Gammaproteobacteria bacterium]|nr:DUF58 domain-containing protein [Gammaproteobacteria bacterium]MDH5261017.1 DUF58 domain-containing protein [Gammaproteobacteria bacterium]MDH5620620.1 DUF58 domain-containing protein [Gammaproteobacteria bacterium]